jgi:hypothetical protein
MPLKDVFDEARRVLDAARDHGVALRGTGGVAVGLRSPSAHRPPLQRAYGDVDFVGDSRQTAAIERLFDELGYAPEREFNDLHGERRLFFFDAQHQREADVFLDGVNACHLLELRGRLPHGSGPLPAADLLLSKLQVVETNHKDFQDALALLADHPVVEEDDPDVISLVRIREVCCNDWGWWRTVTGVAASTLELADRLIAEGQVAPEAATRLREIVADLETAPKSRRWRLRAKVGERKRWHEEPEGLEHSHA